MLKISCISYSSLGNIFSAKHSFNAGLPSAKVLITSNSGESIESICWYWWSRASSSGFPLGIKACTDLLSKLRNRLDVIWTPSSKTLYRVFVHSVCDLQTSWITEKGYCISAWIACEWGGTMGCGSAGGISYRIWNIGTRHCLKRSAVVWGSVWFRKSTSIRLNNSFNASLVTVTGLIKVCCSNGLSCFFNIDTFLVNI